MQKLEGYAGYEIRPIAISPELGDKKNADKVVAKLEEHVAAKVKPLLDGWNEKAVVGAWSVGGHDNAMLEKVIGLLAGYLSTNYTEAVGGATGYEP